MRRLAFLVAALLTAATPRISRPAMQAVEHSFDQRFQRFNVDDPHRGARSARGVYVDKFGVIISAEVNLVGLPQSIPFRPQHQRRSTRKASQRSCSGFAEVRKKMRDTLVQSTATSLETLGPGRARLWSGSHSYFPL